MKNFIRTTVTGGIMILIPLVILVVIFEKVWEILDKISAPLEVYFPHDIPFDLNGAKLFVLLVAILLCFLFGFIQKVQKFSNLVTALENNLLVYIPGYMIIKNSLSERLRNEKYANIEAVSVRDEDHFRIGILTDQTEKYSTIFFPEGPKGDSGEINVFPNEAVTRLNMPTYKISLMLRHYGQGSAKWVEDAEKSE